tara:strand:- start:348 stop:587 length:240 start_codon:yes stop_codon:yes gene_type:complete
MYIKDYKDFINYVYEFYGKGKIYDMKATKEQVVLATMIRLDTPRHKKFPFNGDSADREIVRDILINEFNLKFPMERYND